MLNLKKTSVKLKIRYNSKTKVFNLFLNKYLFFSYFISESNFLNIYKNYGKKYKISYSCYIFLFFCKLLRRFGLKQRILKKKI